MESMLCGFGGVISSGFSVVSSILYFYGSLSVSFQFGSKDPLRDPGAEENHLTLRKLHDSFIQLEDSLRWKRNVETFHKHVELESISAKQMDHSTTNKHPNHHLSRTPLLNNPTYRYFFCSKI